MLRFLSIHLSPAVSTARSVWVQPDFFLGEQVIRYLYDRYWDFYDHALPLSHLSMAEGLAASGYRTVEVIDRFLPFTMQSRLPTADVMVRAY